MNIVYYNPLGLYRDFNSILGNTEHEKIQSLFNPSISIYDRTETIGSPVKILNQYPIPNGNTEKTFEELCHEKILNILSLDSEIGVLFSGGIDSTLITCLLLEHIKPSDKSRIKFFYNDSSIVENKQFLNRYIINNFETGSSWDFENWVSNDNRCMLTGECADNLFGSLYVKTVIERFNDPLIINKPYQPVIEKLWKNKLGKNFDSIYQKFVELSLQCPFKISTVHDWFWWLNFTMKWQAVIYRIYSHTDLSKTKNKIIHFFNSENFQKWSLTNPDLKVKNNWTSYKWIMKDMIYRFDGDDDYRINKVKYPSLPSMVRFKSVTDYIDCDFNSIDKSKLLLN